MMHDSFAVFILTHGRPKSVITFKTLRSLGYTGKIYLVIDNEDRNADEYYKLYGEQVIMFDKLEMSKKVDIGDNLNSRKAVLYARNKLFDIAKSLGIEYFLELDDDYFNFSYRKEIDGLLTQRVKCRQLDKLFDLMLDFLDTTGAKTVALAQGGDFIGGLGSQVYKHKVIRKAMNSFFCKTNNPFEFIGRMNDDVNTYTLLGSQGQLFLTIADVMLNQVATQQSAGGMSEIYLSNGTYIKSFYSVMCMPSAVKISTIGMSYHRIHHRINWNNCVPKILNEKYKK